jgi:thiamine biosynthesis lipoprotein
VVEFAGLQRKLTLTDQSLATSGDYRQRRKIGNIEISHFIDPRTGLPTEQIEQDAADNEVLGSVSVIDKSCIRADALATALTVLGEQKGLAFANQHGIAALFLSRSGSTVREAASKTFP